MKPGTLDTVRKLLNLTTFASVCAAFFATGYLYASRPGSVDYECSGDRLVGTLFTDTRALAVPGKLVLAWKEYGNKKLVSRDLFEICAAVED
jgi:hypothetical protein